jgi:hypothetical protein
MIGFEVSVNGSTQETGDLITTLTLIAEQVRSGERVSLHLACGGDQYAAMDDPAVHWLNADLRPGDEIMIRIVDVDPEQPAPLSNCSFCGAGPDAVSKLVCGPAVAICDGCTRAFADVAVGGGQLPVGAFIRDAPPWRCGFCGKEPGDVPGVFVRNSAAICPECLRVASDVQA